MAIDINLLHEKHDSGRLQKVAKVIRTGSIVLGILTLVSLTVIFVLKREIQSSMESQNDLRVQLIADITQLQERETKILILNQKYKDIMEVIEAEPDYLAYYDTLKKHLPESTTSAQLAAFTISRNGDARVQLNFTNILTLTEFLSSLESEATKEDFAAIKISGVSFNDDDNINFPFGLDVTF